MNNPTDNIRLIISCSLNRDITIVKLFATYYYRLSQNEYIIIACILVIYDIDDSIIMFISHRSPVIRVGYSRERNSYNKI